MPNQQKGANVFSHSGMSSLYSERIQANQFNKLLIHGIYNKSMTIIVASQHLSLVWPIVAPFNLASTVATERYNPGECVCDCVRGNACVRQRVKWRVTWSTVKTVQRRSYRKGQECISGTDRPITADSLHLHSLILPLPWPSHLYWEEQWRKQL